MQNFIIIGQTVLEVSQLFDFQDGRRPPSWILKFLVSHQAERAKMHHLTKFHQNRSQGCRYIAFNVFQNGGRFGTTHDQNLVLVLLHKE